MLNLPLEFKEKYQKLLGQSEADQLFTALNQLSKKAFRINSLVDFKYSNNSLKRVPDIPNAFYGEVNGQDPEWVSGNVYSQDPAAMFPAFISQVKPGQRVLDLVQLQAEKQLL